MYAERNGKTSVQITRKTGVSVRHNINNNNDNIIRPAATVCILLMRGVWESLCSCASSIITATDRLRTRERDYQTIRGISNRIKRKKKI